MSSNFIDVSFKSTVGNELRNKILNIRWNSTGVEPKSFLKDGHELLGKYHVSHTKSWRNGFGEGIKVNDVV